MSIGRLHAAVAITLLAMTLTGAALLFPVSYFNLARRSEAIL
jgi:hypothetical protein